MNTSGGGMLDPSSSSLAGGFLVMVAASNYRGKTSGERVTRVPTGYAKDHARANLLCHKAITAAREFGAPDWLDTPRTADEVAAVWRTIAPLNAWLRKYVGASELPARSR